jgi:DNA repair photolyase
VAPLFRRWLEVHRPLGAAHVMSLVRQMRGGRDYDTRWGQRQTGSGKFAELLAKRFDLATARLGLRVDRPPLDTSRFRPPATGPQLDLFRP